MGDASGTGSGTASGLLDASSTPGQVNVVEISDAGGLDVQIYGASNDSGDSMAVNGQGGNDTFYVESLLIPTTLQGNDANVVTATRGTTTYYVGWQGANQPGSLAGIDALLTVVGTTGTDVLALKDESDPNKRSFSLTSTEVVTDSLGAGGRIAYDGAIDNLDLFAGPGDNSYVVKGTGAAVQTEIHTDNSDNAFVVNAPITAPLAIDGGASIFGGQTLTVNGTSGDEQFVVGPTVITGAGAPIYYTNVQGLTVNGQGGNNSFTLNGDTVPTTLLGGAGNDTFVVNGTSQPTTIDGGDGNDTFTLNGTGAPLTVTGHQGNDTFQVNANNASTTLNGGTGQDSFTVLSNTGSLTLNGGSGRNAANTFNIQGNAGALNVNTNGGATSLSIANVASPVTVDGTSTSATYHITGPISAPINLIGGGVIQNLVVDATGNDENIAITPTSITGLGAPITYTGFLSVTLNGQGGNDQFLVNGNSAPTTINAGIGDSVFNVQAISYPLTLSTGDGASTINLGNPQGAAGALLSSIAASVTITGSGRDTLNLDNGADTLARTGLLTDTNLSGLGIGSGGVTYTGIANLNVALGSGVTAFTVAATAPTTAVSVNTGAGADVMNIQAAAAAGVHVTGGHGASTINVGSLAPAPGGTLAKIVGPVTLTGTGNDTLNIDDSGETTAQAADLTNAVLKGLGMGPAGISYTGISGLNLALGAGGNAVTVEQTAANAVTRILGGGAGDTFNVRATTGRTEITTGTGANTINVGSAAPAGGGTIVGLLGGLSVAGNGVDSLHIDDTADTLAPTGLLTQSLLSGLGIGGDGIAYSGLAALTVALGSGDIHFTLVGTNATTATTLSSGNGNDTFTVQSTGAAATSIQTGGGNDTVNVRSTGGPTAVSVGTGVDTINVGTLAPAIGGTLDGLAGALTLTGGGTDTINLDDSANAAAKSGILSATAATGFSPAPIDFGGDTGLAALNVALGSGGNTVTVSDTPAAATTSIATGTGADSVTLQKTSGPTTVRTGGGNDTVAVQGISAAATIDTGVGVNTVRVGSGGPSTLDGIQGALTVQANAADTLTVDDSGAVVTRVASLTPTTITGLGMAAGGITYTAPAQLNLLLGSGGTTLVVADTAAGTTTQITGNTGNDAITVATDSGPTSITTSSGNNGVVIEGTGAATTVTSAAGAHNQIAVGHAGSVAAIRAAFSAPRQRGGPRHCGRSR